ncbi:MAG: hypothetical protein B7Y87_03100 [Sphingomonadales bacterium 32-64-22]|nr:MAG: hypothetical protein B7Y87_03100 [Sphingomonadales bacterium 32-64-22]
MTEITIEQIEKAIDVASDTVIRNEIYFSDLDGLAGDGDFGTSLATGTMKELAPTGDAAATLKAVTEVADKAIDETRNLVAHRGRASQVGERSANTPDPGIVGVATILLDWCKHYGVDYTPTAAELNR